MKKVILMLLGVLLIGGVARAQYAELLAEKKLNNNMNYLYGFKFLDDERFMVNQNYIGTFLLDTGLNVLIDQPTDCAAKGGGSGMFSSDLQYFMGVTRSSAVEIDTVVFYNLETFEKKRHTFNELTTYTPYTTKNKLLCAHWGQFREFDILSGKSKAIKLDVQNEGFPKASADCVFINADTELLVYTDEKGLMLFDTKKWKLKEVIQEPGVRLSDLQLLPTGLHYSYSLNGTVVVRDVVNHSVYKEMKIANGLIDISFSTDGTYCLYIDDSHGLYYYDLSTSKATLLMASKAYLEFWGLAIPPDGNYFLAGLNGNRILKYRLYQKGEAPKDVKSVEVFSYTVAEAEKIDSEFIRRELALFRLGYDIPLDNSVSRDDWKVFDQFCADHNLKNIHSPEAKKILSLE